MNLTLKQEAFAKAYLETGNASAAYRRAYNAGNMKEESIWRKAKECMDNGKVAARINQLKGVHQKRHDITVDKLTFMTMAAYDLAMTEGVAAPSAAVKASEFLGKLHGLVVERREVTLKDSVEDLTDADLGNIARTGRSRIAAPPDGTPQPH